MVPTEEREPTQPTNSEEQPERFVPTSEHFNLAWKRLKKKQEHAQPLQETPKIKHTQQALQTGLSFETKLILLKKNL